MRKFITFSLLAVSVNAIADIKYETGYITDIERVSDSIIKSVPYQHCYIKDFYKKSGGASDRDKLVGAIFGGIIGNQFGGGDGKKAMTAAGALWGASLADEENQTGEVTRKEVCETRYKEKRVNELSHYLVSYEYNGESHTYSTRSRPNSKNIELKVSVSPRF